MRKLSPVLVTLALSLLIPTVSRAAEPPAPTEKTEISNRPKIAIADFRGSDVEMSRFLAETVISNLASSRTLKPLDRPTVRRAIAAEVTEADSEPTQEEIFRAGKRLRSAYFLTGSYLIQQEKILLLAHIHSMKEQDAPDIQIRCTGDRADIMDVATRLSNQVQDQLNPREEVRTPREEIHATRTTREETPIERPERENPIPESVEANIPVAIPARPAVPVAPAVADPFAVLRESGFCPANITSGGNVSTGDLSRLLGRLSEVATIHANFTLPRTAAPAQRLLALTGLVKLMLTPEEIADYRRNTPANLPSDFVHVPLWGQPFLAAAVDHGWWDSARPFRSAGNANWAFVAYLTTRMGLTVVHAKTASVEIEDDIYTGLVIDGRDLRVERSQSPSILDEDGDFVYPYQKHAPSADYVGENGMVDYNFDIADQTRAGKHPLVIQALKIAGPFHDDLVISNEDAERIRRAQKRSQFLWRWKVVFLVPNN